MRPKPPTQADIAQRAGVSTGTVSRVLNGKDHEGIAISDETRQRVLAAAEELGYTSNRVAQMLATGKNNLVGVFTYEPEFPHDQGNKFFPYLVGVQREAGRRGYDVLLFTHSRGRQPAHIYKNSMNSLRLADGSILLGTHPNYEELERLIKEDYPFVFIGRREVPGYEIDWVVNDYASASFEATQHLIELGHHHIGLIISQPETEFSQDMLQGCYEAADQVDAVELTSLSAKELGISNLQAFIEHRQLTALMCMNWDEFEVVMYLLAQIGMRVPEDISLVTKDAPGKASQHPSKPTGIWIDRQTVGEEAVRILHDRLEDREREPQHVLIPSKFIVGETTARVSKRLRR